MTEGITFQAQINKLQTTTDGGFRITLDAGEQDIEALKELINFKDELITVAVVPEPSVY